MLSDIEIMLFSMMAESFTQENGVLILTCSSENIFTQKKLLESFLAQKSEENDTTYCILEERVKNDKIVFVTNMPFQIYQKDLEGQRNDFMNSFSK